MARTRTSSGRGGESTVTRGRGRGGRARRKDGKKACELGADCPYQDEYQHQLEYHHEASAKKKKEAVKAAPSFRATGSSGAKLGGSMTSEAGGHSRVLAAAESRIRGAGAVSRAKKAGAKKSSARKPSDQVIVVDDDASIRNASPRKVGSRKRERCQEVIVLDDDDDDDVIILASDSDDDSIEILETIKAPQQSDDDVEIIESLSSAERSRSLRDEQDAEYETSLAADRKKETEKKAAEKKMHRRKAVKEAFLASEAEARAKKFQKKNELDAQIPLTHGIRLRLRLPDSVLSRTFAHEATLSHVLEFVSLNLPDLETTDNTLDSFSEEYNNMPSSALRTENDIALVDATTRQRYTAKQKSSTLKSLGLGEAASLLVVLLDA